MNKKKRELHDELFNEAIKFRDAEKFELAVENLSRILNDNPEPRTANAAYGVLGHVFMCMNDYVKSAECFQKVVKDAPFSELASLGLFHSLIDLGKIYEAFKEMQRYLKLSESDEYLQLLTDMKLEFQNELMNLKDRQDIDNEFQIDSTEKTRKINDKNLFTEAIKFRDAKQFDLAAESLSKIIDDPNDLQTLASAKGILGHVFMCINDYTQSAECFQEVVNEAPTSELASAGLFHSLWGLGETDKAFEEMARFMVF